MYTNPNIFVLLRDTGKNEITEIAEITTILMKSLKPQ